MREFPLLIEEPMSFKIRFPVLLAAAMMAVAWPIATALKPTQYIADQKPALVLESVIPRSFGQWHELTGFRKTVPDPTVQAMVDSLYSQTLTRAYYNDKEQVIVVTIAYGHDQNSEATAAHRPEFCYVGGGFRMDDLGAQKVDLGSGALVVRHMLASKPGYQEKISYWVTLDETATLPGFGRKLAQISYGLKGMIADGMLVRVSSPQAVEGDALGLHAQFLRELHDQVPLAFRTRIFGT